MFKFAPGSVEVKRETQEKEPEKRKWENVEDTQEEGEGDMDDATESIIADLESHIKDLKETSITLKDLIQQLLKLVPQQVSPTSTVE